MSVFEHYIGNYGADRLIPHIYEEVNTGVKSDNCTVAVLDKDCAEYIIDHINKFYHNLIPELKAKDDTFIHGFTEHYTQRFASRLKIVDSKDNISYGNFGIFRSNEPLKGMTHVLISPYSSLSENIPTFLKSLDRYFFSHGILPSVLTRDNVLSIESAMNSIIARNANSHSGVYKCSNVKLSKGLLVGYDNGDNGIVECHVLDNENNLRRYRLSSLSYDDLNCMKPFFREFQSTFQSHLCSFVEYSGKYRKPARKIYNMFRDCNNQKKDNVLKR